MSTTPPGTQQSGLAGPSLATVYHHWYVPQGGKIHPDSAYAAGETREQGGSRGEDEVSSAGGSRIVSGESVMPPAARVILDLEPAPHGCVQNAWWPSWDFEMYDEGGNLKLKGTLNNENPAVPGFISIQSPESSTSVWNTSSGYRLIAAIDGQSFKGSLHVRGRVGNWVTPGKLIIPAISAL